MFKTATLQSRDVFWNVSVSSRSCDLTSCGHPCAVPTQSQLRPRQKHRIVLTSRYIYMLTLATAASVPRAGDRKTRVRVRGPLFDSISHSCNSAFHCLTTSETFILHPPSDAAATAAAGEVSQASSDLINAFIITSQLDFLGRRFRLTHRALHDCSTL